MGSLCVVELQVTASSGVESVYFLDVALGQVSEEVIEIWVSFLRNGLATAAEVKHGG